MTSATATSTGPRILHGTPLAAELRREVSAEVDRFRAEQGHRPALAVMIIGDDAPARLYLEQILRVAGNVGIAGRMVELPAAAAREEVSRALAALSADPTVAGIIVQMPLPGGIPITTVIDAMDPAKDIDGIHPLNFGRRAMGLDGFLPACAEAAVELLVRSDVPIEGRRAVVIGRSNVVGKPVQILLVQRHATVTVCHRRTRDLAAEVRAADLVVVGAGSPGLVTGDMLKPGAVVVDVGINVVPEGIVGDVDHPSASRVASAITPVPGGVGPLTNAILMEHVIRAARAQAASR